MGQYVIEIVRFDRTVHTEAYRRLNIEHLTWAIDQLREQHGYIASSESGQTIPEYVDEHLEDLTRLHPPDGIIYFTDGEGPYPPEDPGVKTLWVLTKPAPFGCPWGTKALLPDENHPSS